MGFFDFLKTKWFSIEMTDLDRQKIFWYQKRKSSYTAWKAQSDAFDDFARIFERQVMEEPIAVKEGFPPNRGTDWEGHWPEILKAQVLYEEALERLLQGDRTVWLYNDRGIFDDAQIIPSYWYVALVNHGPQGDVFFQGKYVDALTEAIEAVSQMMWATAGIVQPMMANTPALNFFSRASMDELDQKIPFPQYLPEVPTPTEIVTFRSGAEVPFFGIYEAQSGDGYLNYLLAGTPAPEIWERDRMLGGNWQRPVLWRLIWKDERYFDGTIPAEEREYFPKQAQTEVSQVVAADDLLSAVSHQTCPKAGVWAVADKIDARAFFNAGVKLPQYENRDATWVWIQR